MGLCESRLCLFRNPLGRLMEYSPEENDPGDVCERVKSEGFQVHLSQRWVMTQAQAAL